MVKSHFWQATSNHKQTQIYYHDVCVKLAPRLTDKRTVVQLSATSCKSAFEFHNSYGFVRPLKLKQQCSWYYLFNLLTLVRHRHLHRLNAVTFTKVKFMPIKCATVTAFIRTLHIHSPFQRWHLLKKGPRIDWSSKHVLIMRQVLAIIVLV